MAEAKTKCLTKKEKQDVIQEVNACRAGTKAAMQRIADDIHNLEETFHGVSRQISILAERMNGFETKLDGTDRKIFNLTDNLAKSGYKDTSARMSAPKQDASTSVINKIAVSFDRQREWNDQAARILNALLKEGDRIRKSDEAAEVSVKVLLASASNIRNEINGLASTVRRSAYTEAERILKEIKKTNSSDGVPESDVLIRAVCNTIRDAVGKQMQTILNAVNAANKDASRPVDFDELKRLLGTLMHTCKESRDDVSMVKSMANTIKDDIRKADASIRGTVQLYAVQVENENQDRDGHMGQAATAEGSAGARAVLLRSQAVNRKQRARDNIRQASRRVPDEPR